MNISKTVLDYIEQYPEDEPIFIEDIKKYVMEKCKDKEKECVSKNINVILNRLKNRGIIKTEFKGVYYKPIISMFGEMTLDTKKLRKLPPAIRSEAIESLNNAITAEEKNEVVKRFGIAK